MFNKAIRRIIAGSLKTDIVHKINNDGLKSIKICQENFFPFSLTVRTKVVRNFTNPYKENDCMTIFVSMT